MSDVGFIVSSLISVALIFITVAFLIKNKSKKTKSVPPLNILIVGVFAAVFAIFVPIYIDYYKNESAIVRVLLLAFHNTLRVFILDGEFDIIRNAASNLETPNYIWFTLYSSFLFVLSPILTAGFVLSMLKNVNSEIRYFFSHGSGLFIFSNLNNKSVAIAESIYNNPKIKNPVIVFADVSEKTYETYSESVSLAKKINAILFEKNISDINIEHKRGRLEIFYIGDDEAENVSNASDFIISEYKHKKVSERIDDENGTRFVKVPKKYNQRTNTKVFAFARSEGSARVMDSLVKGNNFENLDEKYFEDNNIIDDSKLFKVRRVDDVKMLAWDSVENADLFSHYREIDGEKVISVLIIGMGEYGCELLRTLVWYGQIAGFRLEINVVHNGENGESVIAHMCPELISTNDKKVDGDSFYSIRFYDRINVFNSSWDDLIFFKGDEPQKSEAAKRIASTTVAFVALGDDDKNIQAAVELRTMFDRINSVCATENSSVDELPVIFSVVYNEQKSINVSGVTENGKDARSLITHKNQPYNIRFIGSHSSQYRYDFIYRENLEKEAFNTCHMSWSYYSVDRDIEKIEESEKRVVSDAEKQKLRAKARKEQISLYESFEYFRFSSMAKAMHKKLINEKFSDKFICDNPSYECDCEKCWARRANEHNRWNAYVRSIGYVYGKQKADRAKIHYDLVPFDELSDAAKHLD